MENSDMKLEEIMKLKRNLKSAEQYFISVLVLTIVMVLIYGIGFDQSSKVYETPAIIQQPLYPKITASMWGRFGNHLFEYSTMIGVGKWNNMTPIVIESSLIWQVFKIPTPKGTIQHLGMYINYKEKLPAAFTPSFRNLHKSYDAYLRGYLQSWKYFDHVREDLLKNHLVFQDRIQQESMKYIENAKKEHNRENAIVVGIHVRRGDFVRQKRKGFTVAPVPYVYRAMAYFRKKYKNVLFIICSNDIMWCHDHLDDAEDVHYSHLTDDWVDFAVLANSDHMVMTAGSYSWWAGYLCKGEVIYYKGYPEPNTKIGNLTVRDDYYPRNWISM